jgi:CP family cyanate transporter-like MFS transporter
MIFQGLLVWLAAVYVERGWSEAQAGLLVGVLIVSGLPVTLVASWAADRIGSRRTYLATASAILAIGTAGLAFIPDPGWLWVTAIGGSLGVLFPLTMTLPLDIADTPSEVAAASSMMFGVGYVIAAISPVALGAVRDLTGSFTAALVVLTGVAIVLFISTLTLTPRRLSARAPARIV